MSDGTVEDVKRVLANDNFAQITDIEWLIQRVSGAIYREMDRQAREQPTARLDAEWWRFNPRALAVAALEGAY